ncbi:Dbl-like domain-containing protein [Hysterangium stoloniferum]|nr:Dbl-like domain-containing protein [Hysterangium stoloniferum]
MAAILLELHHDFDDDIDEDPDRFVILSLLSHLAVRLRDKVPRGTHVKGSIPYHRAFTGKDIVSTIQSQIQRELLINMGISTNDRRTALGVARSLQSQLFFYEVEWGGRQLSDGVEDVFMFLDDSEGMSGETPEREELPTGVITLLTKCYSPGCTEGVTCYAYGCPRRASTIEWPESVDPQILRTLPPSEIKRQTVIRKVIEKEEQYVQDLDTIESLFIKPLRKNYPQIIPPDELDGFIDAIFGNVLDLRECNRRLLETMYVRQREQAPLIQRIGDIFLTAAAEFRLPYPDYVGHLPVAEKRMKDEMEHNAEFRRFIDICARHPDARRFDLRHFITRPSEHLQRYPVLLEAIFKDTTEGNPDAEFLQEAIDSIRKLSGVAHVRTFQSAMLRGPTAKLEWHDLVSAEIREGMTKHEVARQSSIFELIKGEMEYVKDLENIDLIFIAPLRNAVDSPIIPRERLQQFVEDVFYNIAEIRKHHRRMLNRLHEIQREEHPHIHSITASIFDAALNWRDAYMEFIPHYPIAAYRIDEELANNPTFKTFVEQCTKHHESRRLDIKAFNYRPIPRLLRYDLLLKSIMTASPPEHEDRDTIPQVLEVIKSLGKDSEPGVVSAKQKVELWKYNANLVFKPGETVDMDLLNENRTLIHTGKLLRQPETGFEWNGWSELFVLLFDNYLVMTKPKDRDGVMKYHVNRHPIPLDLLTLASFTDPPQQRGTGLLRGLRGGHNDGSTIPNNTMPNANNAELPVDSRTVYPCTIHHNGRLGGLYTLYAESAQARLEWKNKLEDALVLRKAVTENNKVFEAETLSCDTFLVPSIQGPSNAAYNQETILTGKVTCSVPFSTAEGLRLVAIGCSEGVWIGLRHDAKSMRRVLHLKMVTQCAMLEDFGIFLVLADKSLWAYHIEALVPSSPPRPNMARAPQKLNNHKEVQFFSVGTINGRTLLIWMKKKGLESIFHAMEPVLGKIAEKAKAPGTFGRSLFGSQRSDWFRPYREFFLPSEAFDLVFLKGKIAVLCTKGFEIMDLNDLKSVTIPQRDDTRLGSLAKRCETGRPLGMFRSNENEFLLCYNEFGMYVDRYGDPSRPTVGLIEWEGTAERVAFHSPYVLLFDSRFIEIRHVETGRLAQIISGEEVRCIWDGRGSAVNAAATPGLNGWQETPSQEAHVHAVMKASDPSRMRGVRSSTVAQQVVELIPTIPLFLPGSLSSPAPTSTYFQGSASPPQSPQMTPLRWR